MPQRSAGVLLYRRADSGVELFLVHPGGPFWASRDAGAWSVPKGLVGDDEDLRAAACREFREETGQPARGPFIELPPVRLPSGKVVHVFAADGECDPEAISSNTFTMEWPRGSGRMREFPEVDRAGWFTLAEARAKLHRGQQPLVELLAERLGVSCGDERAADDRQGRLFDSE